MKKIILGLFLVFTQLFFSCGFDRTYTGEQTNFSESVSSGGNPLSDQEMAVALRICYAFRSKRTLFLAQRLESNFSFNYVAKDCDDQVTDQRTLSTTLKQLLPDGPISYELVGANFPYMREVRTDINGELENYCSDVFQGDTPLDVVESNNEFFEYEFLNETYDTVIIRIGGGLSPVDPTPVVSRIIRMQVLTNQQSSGNFLGIVNSYSERTRCGNELVNNNFRSFEQSFIAP